MHTPGVDLLAMATATEVPTASQPKTLKDPQLKRDLQKLRELDNWTNWLYIARAWLVIGVSVAASLGLQWWLASAGYSSLWNIPVWTLAIIAIGASQHQLAGATHEATHHTLFKNKKLNELASDWLCMFPLFSSTYTFRLHHLAHHNFINDPDRDPDFGQLRSSGHWLRFPILAKDFVVLLLKQLYLVNLIKYMIVRMRYNSVGVDQNPYITAEMVGNPWMMRVVVLYVIGLFAGMIALSRNSTLEVTLGVAAGAYAGIMLFLALIPANWFPRSRLKPVFSFRSMAMQRITFTTLIVTALAVGKILSGEPTWFYVFMFWAVPAFTSFSLFMILRQLVQHGNGDRGWLTNTRVFLTNPLINYAVFPFGMDYHLPHHMFATIPHYRLPQLHATLLEYPEYRDHGIVVEGYFGPRYHGQTNPTVLEVLGPDYAPVEESEAFIDNSVVEEWTDRGEAKPSE
jgi:fatty acid desaturase